MRLITLLLIVSLVFPLGIELFANDDDSAAMLGDAVLGGLLGAGVGAAIGSASGKAGQGAAVGAGVGALSGAVLGTMSRSGRRRKDREYNRGHYDRGYYKPGAHKRIIREYDEEGNLISERETYYEE